MISTYRFRIGTGQQLGEWRMPEHTSMIFVDGENLAIEGAKLIEEFLPDKQAPESPFFERNTFLWLPSFGQARRLDWYAFNPMLFPPAVRSYYFTTYDGNDNTKLDSIKNRLKALDMDANVFKKIKGKSKFVDVKLTITVLHHAYQNHFDTAFLFAGDADYIPLIEELKGIGKRVHIVFFESCTKVPMRQVADRFFPIDRILQEYWEAHANKKVAIQRVPMDFGPDKPMEVELEKARSKYSMS